MSEQTSSDLQDLPPSEQLLTEWRDTWHSLESGPTWTSKKDHALGFIKDDGVKEVVEQQVTARERLVEGMAHEVVAACPGGTYDQKIADFYDMFRRASGVANFPENVIPPLMQDVFVRTIDLMLEQQGDQSHV